MHANGKALRRVERKREFDHNRVLPVADYYQPIFADLQFANGWVQRAVRSSSTKQAQ
jgi:hypothetical protein